MADRHRLGPPGGAGGVVQIGGLFGGAGVEGRCGQGGGLGPGGSILAQDDRRERGSTLCGHRLSGRMIAASPASRASSASLASGSSAFSGTRHAPRSHSASMSMINA